MSIRSNVDASSLDQRITIQRKTETVSASGSRSSSWADVVTTWAKVDATKASQAEAYINDGIRTVSDYTFWVRADIKSRFSVTPLDRIVWGGTIYNIKDIPDQQLRGRMVAMFASAGKNNG